MALILNKGRYFTKGEVLLLGDGLLLTKTTYAPDQKIPTHLHQDSYLAVIVEGNYREIGVNFDDAVKPGTSIYHPGKEVHKNQMGPTGAVLLNLEMPDTFWKKKGLADLKPDIRILGDDPRYLEYASKISDEVTNSKRLTLLGLEGLSLKLLDLFLNLNLLSADRPELLGKVDKYLHENFAKTLTIEQISEIFEIVPGWLAKNFRRHFGENIGDRVTRLRINEAINLLNNTKKTLSEIGINVGFFDQSHFTRTFKKHRGISPGQYRRLSTNK